MRAALTRQQVQAVIDQCADMAKDTPSCPPGCTTDHNQPKRGGVRHPEIDRLMVRHPHMFGGEHTHGNTHTYRP
jgi:hypothetical protein